MNKRNLQEIRETLEKRRRRDQERMRQEEQAMSAFAVQAGRSFIDGLPDVTEDPRSWDAEPSAETTPIETTPIETTPAAQPESRHAIEARRQHPASSSPAPRPGEPPLRAALRGIVEDYAAPVTPSERIVTDLEAVSGIALDEADTYGLWANLELDEVLAVRAAMRDVVDIVTDRAESIIVAELVAARDSLARDYPDVPNPDPADANGEVS